MGFGMVAEKAHRGPGRPRALSAQDLGLLKAIVEAHPDLTLRQIGALMEQRHGKRATPITYSRALKELGLRKVRRKKIAEDVEKPAAARITRYREVHRREPAPGRYPSSLTDHEWEALQPLLESNEGRGRPARHDRRTMWNAVFYLVRSGGLVEDAPLGPSALQGRVRLLRQGAGFGPPGASLRATSRPLARTERAGALA